LLQSDTKLFLAGTHEMKRKFAAQLASMNLRVLVCVALLYPMALCAYAETITVTNTNDSGPGSLRQALADANDGDTINFTVTGTIALTSGELVVDKSVTISGPGPTLLAVWGYVTLNAGFRVFHVTPNHTMTIGGLTISEGSGGIYNDQGTLTVNNCAVIYNYANGGDGGGVNNASGTLIIINSTVRGNSADGGGGGISSYDGTLTITGSTIADNFALFAGGGISASGTIEISDSTISGNAAGGGDNHIPGQGGGIFTGGTLTINNSTISWNTAWGNDFKGPGLGGGIYFWDETGSITNSILSYNSASEGDNIYGGVISLGYNVCSDDCGLNGPGDLNNTDPLLGPLQNNGGPTFTHELLPGSPAIDAGNPRFTPPPIYDQRGPSFWRVRNRHIDIGSFEVQAGQTPRPRPSPHPRPTPP
jgi:hypothetical protein